MRNVGRIPASSRHMVDAAVPQRAGCAGIPPRHPPGAVRAVALLRTIIALAIVAVALLGMMAYYLQSYTLSGAGQEAETASSAAREKLEQIRLLSYRDIRLAYPPDTPVYFDVAGLTPVPPGNRPGSVTVRYPDIIHAEVVIRVRWKGIRGESSIPPLSKELTPP
jgi:hypothetical protein